MLRIELFADKPLKVIVDPFTEEFAHEALNPRSPSKSAPETPDEYGPVEEPVIPKAKLKAA